MRKGNLIVAIFAETEKGGLHSEQREAEIQTERERERKIEKQRQRRTEKETDKDRGS